LHTANTTIDADAVERYLSNWEKKETSQIINGVFVLGLKDYSRYARHLGTISWKSDEDRIQRQKEIEDILAIDPLGIKEKGLYIRLSVSCTLQR
jgi:hypothetical protein